MRVDVPRAISEPCLLLYKLLGNGYNDESVFSLLSRLQSEVEAGSDRRLLAPVKQALAKLRIDQGILTRYRE
jgi:hypothetical protein